MTQRLDVGALYGALDAKRRGEGRSWRDLAKGLGVHASVFTRMGQGRKPDLDTFFVLTEWLDVPSERFVGRSKARDFDPEETVAVISTYLRADRSLKPESAQAIETVVRAAYEQLAEKDQ